MSKKYKYTNGISAGQSLLQGFCETPNLCKFIEHRENGVVEYTKCTKCKKRYYFEYDDD